MSCGQKNNAISDTVAASLVCSVLSAAKLIGLDTPLSSNYIELESLSLTNPTQQVEFTVLLKLLKLLKDISDDESLGMQIGQRLSFSSYISLGYAASNSKTLNDALNLLPIYESSILSLAKTDIFYCEENIEVHWSKRFGQYDAILEDLIFASWINLGKALSDNNIIPIKTHFTHKEPKDIKIWIEIFGQNILFNQASAKIIFSKATLALPIPKADPFIHHIMIKEASAFNSSLKEQSFTEMACHWISQQLHLGDISQIKLSYHLNLSHRTLRRYLKKENTSYEEILDNVRKEKAHYYLTQTRLTLSEITSLLGYRHLPAFNTAYKRWTGVTPASTRSLKLP